MLSPAPPPQNERGKKKEIFLPLASVEKAVGNKKKVYVNTNAHSNSFFLIPVFHFPWSEKGRENRLAKQASHTV